MPRDLLLEIGAEELPASFVKPALEDVARIFRERAEQVRLTHGEVQTFGTPRRLALLVPGVAESSPDLAREIQGPGVKAAFDATGKPTKAAEKFAEVHGIAVSQLTRVSTPKGEYLCARVTEKGKPAAQLLPEILHAAVHGIAFPKSMRWGDVEQAFARPVHWLVALRGTEVLPVVFGDVRSGRVTYGHRFEAPGPIELKSPAEYVAALARAHVVVDIGQRRQALHERLRAAAQAAGGTLLEDDALLDQVTQLVEEPHPVVGSFERRHLDLPPEVLVQEMKSHQRYFSVLDGAGKLAPSFIAVSNTAVDEKLSTRGYERVLQARLADGRFFFDEDRKEKLADRIPKLARVVFQHKLGTYAEKVTRMGSLAQWLARGVGYQDVATLERAAQLAKADLVTGMVGEFPELQGVMGREYARASGESAEVALAIYEHYLPRTASDALPTRDAGALLGLADRLDTLCGIFGIGKPPTGAADPFGLRRACLAIINVVLARSYRFSLSGAIGEALRLLAPKLSDVKRKPGEPATADQVLDFFRGRLKALWGEKHRPDVVEAVLAAGFDDLPSARGRLEALSRQVASTDFAALAGAFKRVANIVEKQGKDVGRGAADPALFVEAAERELHGAYTDTGGRVSQLVRGGDYAGALQEIVRLKPAVDTFFDKVMVMAEDKKLRENRVRLLAEIASLFGQVADFSKLQGET